MFLCEALTHEYYGLTDVVFQVGDFGEKYYIVLSGKVTVHVPSEEIGMQDAIHEDTDGEMTPDGRPMILRRVLKSGDSFGEYALITNAPRSATITSQGKTHLAVLSKADYDESIGYFCEQKVDTILNVLRN